MEGRTFAVGDQVAHATGDYAGRVAHITQETDHEGRPWTIYHVDMLNHVGLVRTSYRGIWPWIAPVYR